MEDATWKKDINPYVIFICTKCHQYLYAKTTQKTKKCLRCRKTYKVILILNNGERVYGISNAIKRVKELQNALGASQFSTENEFSICSKIKAKKDLSRAGDEYESLFIDLLKELSSKYKEFPFYMMELMAQECHIPPMELKILIRKFVKEKKLILISKKTHYYLFNYK